jgi:hypothetical protein
VGYRYRRTQCTLRLCGNLARPHLQGPARLEPSCNDGQ